MEGFHLFTLAGIPVRATFGFLLLVGYYAYSLRAGGLAAIVAWLLAVVVSFLVHEFGHAMVARRFKLAPKVYLHGWGGLCAHDRAARDRDDALIIIAGPLAGLALAALVALAQGFFAGPIRSDPFLFFLFESLWFINFYWSLVNLLPLFPLDGGQLFRLGLLRVIKPASKAERVVHIVGIAIAAFGLVYAIMIKSILLGIISAALIYTNVRYLSQGSPTRVRTRNTLVDQLLMESIQALASGDPREARRLAYQARDERNLSGDQVERAFELLTITSAALEDWEETLDWARRTNATPAVDEARVMALVGLGRIDEARHVAAESNLGAEARARIEKRFGCRLG